jgi:EF-P beta-lysylation protein EpmB
MTSWQRIFSKNFRKLDLLLDFLELSNSQRETLKNDLKFPINVPLRLANSMKKGSLEDPLVKQFLSFSDNSTPKSYSEDPVEDAQFRKTPKLLKKYQGRVLLLTSATCPMHCRYCFRQNFDYQQEDKTFAEEISFIKSDESIKEVILSGGDPLSLSNETLSKLLTSIDQIPHITKIRFHTRFPIGIPERIDSQFVKILSALKKQVIFIIHTNHINELDQDIFDSLGYLQAIKIPILTQTVLLRGVNDNVETLASLFEALTNQGIIPYYLHQLDQIEGSSYLEVSKEKGKELITKLRSLLPGYAIPSYVKEIPNKPNKTPLL